MSQQKTHREVKKPQISARQLADYMAATETARRTIIRNCKYQPIARVVQHSDARLAISKFFRDGKKNADFLVDAANKIRSRIFDTAFEKDVNEHNADYIDKFSSVLDKFALPDAKILAPGQHHPMNLGGVKVTVDLSNRLERLTSTNKIRIGAIVLRYSKGKSLPISVGDWQSSLIFGYITTTNTEEAAEPERKLCITLDAYSGTVFAAPSDSIRRFKNIEAACATIAERWPNVGPPENAVL